MTKNTETKLVVYIYWSYFIFVLFSPQVKFFAQFFSTPKRVNRDKTDFATKQRKSHKREILQQNSIKCDKTSKIVHIIYFAMLKEMTNQGEESGEER